MGRLYPKIVHRDHEQPCVRCGFTLRAHLWYWPARVFAAAYPLARKLGLGRPCARLTVDLATRALAHVRIT